MTENTLYTKYRPKNFKSIVGQDHVSKTLSNAFKAEELPHAFLFSGLHGTGKTSTAKILARAVNCENPQNGEPCNSCNNCLLSLNGSHPDIIEMDAASNRGIDSIRDIISTIPSRPQTGRKRVYIIDEIHMLTQEAFNALLKNLEEPPSHVMFILATTDIQRVPSTIISRCQVHNFRKIPEQLIAKSLLAIAFKEGYLINKEAIGELTSQARGSLRDAIGTLQGVHDFAQNETISVDMVAQYLGGANNAQTQEIISYIVEHNAINILSLLNLLYKRGFDEVQFLLDLEKSIRKIWLTNISEENESYAEIDSSERDFIFSTAEKGAQLYFAALIELIESAIVKITSSNVNPRITLECCLMYMCSPETEPGVIGLVYRENINRPSISSTN